MDRKESVHHHPQSGSAAGFWKARDEPHNCKVVVRVSLDELPVKRAGCHMAFFES